MQNYNIYVKQKTKCLKISFYGFAFPIILFCNSFELYYFCN